MKRRLFTARRGAVLVTAVLASMLLTIHSSSASPSSEPLDDVTLEAAALQLAADVGIDVPAARSQLLLQDAQLEASAAASQAVGDTWGGSWIDRKDGTLVLLGTDVARLSAWSSNYSAESGARRVEQVAHSLGELQAAAQRISAQNLTGVNTWTKMSANQVVVEIATDTWFKAHGIDELKVLSTVDLSAKATKMPYVIERLDPPTEMSCKSATYSVCSNPLRGGVELLMLTSPDGASDFKTGEMCSTGFNVKKDGVKYVLTAGHCRGTHPYTWAGRDTPSDHSSYYVGVIAWNEFVNNPDPSAGTAQDFGFVRLSGNAGWTTASTVNIMASSVTVSGTTYTTVANESYPITGVGSTSTMPESSYLCRTGATALTKCGPFLSIDSVGRGVTRVPTCQGDSGGPFVIAGKGYGIASIAQANTAFSGHTYWSGAGTNGSTAGVINADGVACYSPGNGNGSSRYQQLAPALSWFGATL